MKHWCHTEWLTGARRGGQRLASTKGPPIHRWSLFFYLLRAEWSTSEATPDAMAENQKYSGAVIKIPIGAPTTPIGRKTFTSGWRLVRPTTASTNPAKTHIPT